jgi:hypothetical protein
MISNWLGSVSRHGISKDFARISGSQVGCESNPPDASTWPVRAWTLTKLASVTCHFPISNAMPHCNERRSPRGIIDYQRMAETKVTVVTRHTADERFSLDMDENCVDNSTSAVNRPDDRCDGSSAASLAVAI